MVGKHENNRVRVGVLERQPNQFVHPLIEILDGAGIRARAVGIAA